MRSREQPATRRGGVAWTRSVRRWGAAWAVCLAVASLCPSAPAVGATPGATSSRAAKEEAVAEIPFDRIKGESRARLLEVLERPSIYRRLPTQTIPCDPDMYLFLLRNPEVVVNIWELMGVTNVHLKRTGEYTFECADGAGTVGTVELVYGTHDLHVLYAKATYEGPLTGKKLHGRGVLVLKSTYKKDAAGNLLVDNRLDVFIQIDQMGAELVARTLQPLVGKAADANFEESALFVGRVSQAAEANGPGMQRLASKLTNIAPEVRSQFSEVAALVTQRAAARQASAPLATPPAAQLRR